MKQKRSDFNIVAFKALIKQYSTITLKEIKNLYLGTEEDDWLPQDSTGFGCEATCTLCISEKELEDYDEGGCNHCVYKGSFANHCHCSSYSRDTYEGIDYAETPEDLYHAYKARAKFMRLVLKDFNKKHPK